MVLKASKIIAILLAASILFSSVVWAASEGIAGIKAGVDNLPPSVADASAELSFGEKNEIIARFSVVEHNGMADLLERQCALESPGGKIASTAPAKVEQCGLDKCKGECTLLLGEPQDGTYKVVISVVDKGGSKAQGIAEFDYAGPGKPAANEQALGNGAASRARATPAGGQKGGNAATPTPASATHPAAQKSFLDLLLEAIGKILGLFK